MYTFLILLHTILAQLHRVFNCGVDLGTPDVGGYTGLQAEYRKMFNALNKNFQSSEYEYYIWMFHHANILVCSIDPRGCPWLNAFDRFPWTTNCSNWCRVFFSTQFYWRLPNHLRHRAATLTRAIRLSSMVLGAFMFISLILWYSLSSFRLFHFLSHKTWALAKVWIVVCKTCNGTVRNIAMGTCASCIRDVGHF